MPRLLKSETDRRLRVCQETLVLAFSLLANPKPWSYEPKETDGAVEIGLMEISADLAISACLFEVLGSQGIIRKSNGFYLTAGEALDAFRKMLTSKIPRLASLTHGVTNPVAHLKRLSDASIGFGVLFTARAAAVHAGAGTSFDVAFSVGKSVADFLVLLAESPKWKPYLKDVPGIPQLPKDRTLIAQELKDAALKGNSAALAGIFLVLPELASTEPEWLASLGRVRVTPKANDISVLIKTLQHARIGNLSKVGKGSNAISTRIDNDNPNALPIYTAGFKKSFDAPADSWSAYVGNANAEIKNGVLSLPPIDTIYKFAATGLDGIGLPEEDLQQGLAAHSLWPFIASALHYSGTKGPCFFLVRRLKAGEGGQLTSLLKQAAKKSAKIENQLTEYLPLFSAVCNQENAPTNSSLAKALAVETERRANLRDRLLQALAARAKKWKGTGSNPCGQIQATIQETGTVGGAILSVCAEAVDLGDDKFPVLTLLLNAATEQEEIESLVEVLTRKEFAGLWSYARKSIRVIDFSLFGPQP